MGVLDDAVPRDAPDPDRRADPAFDPECELCEAAGLTERFYVDDDCWIAECESCFVPMIVWRHHVVEPPADVRGRLRARLSAVVAQYFDGAFWIDENMRSIPTHYHAHARPRHGVGASGLRRRTRHDQPPATAIQPSAMPTTDHPTMRIRP